MSYKRPTGLLEYARLIPFCEVCQRGVDFFQPLNDDADGRRHRFIVRCHGADLTYDVSDFEHATAERGTAFSADARKHPIERKERQHVDGGGRVTIR